MLFLAGVFGFLSLMAAESIGMGPSGVLTTLVSTGGLPNAPGYPLYGLLSQLFLLIPFGEPAYRLNLMSSLISSLVVYLVYLNAKELLQQLGPKPHDNIAERIDTFLVGIGSLSILGSSGFLRNSDFAERYGLIPLFGLIGLYLLLKIQLTNSSVGLLKRYCGFLAVILGLSPSIHYLFVPFALFCMITAVFLVRGPVTKKFLFVTIFFGTVAGMLIYLWLPYRASGSPFFNWGNPVNFQNLKYVLMRREYGGSPLDRDWAVWSLQWIRQYELLFYEFKYWLLLALPPLAAVLIKRQWRRLGLILGFLIIAGEATTFLVNFAVPSEGLIKGYMDWMMLNYYLFYFSGIAVLVAVGFVLSIRFILRSIEHARGNVSNSIRIGFAVGGFLLIAITVWRGSAGVFPQTHFVVNEIVQNVEASTESDSIILTNTDSFYFPAFYHQIFKHHLQDRLLIHTDLFKRSWYVRSLSKLDHPALLPLANEFRSYQVLLEAHENSGQVNVPAEIWAHHDQLLKKIVDSRSSYYFGINELQGWNGVNLHPYRLESNGVLYRLVKDFGEVRPLNLERLTYRHMIFAAQKGDFWGLAFWTGLKGNARRWYKLARFVEPKSAVDVKNKIIDRGIRDFKMASHP